MLAVNEGSPTVLSIVLRIAAERPSNGRGGRRSKPKFERKIGYNSSNETRFYNTLSVSQSRAVEFAFS